MATSAFHFSRVAQAIPPNVFAQMDQQVLAYTNAGADIIDLSKGNPDAYPASYIRSAARNAVDDPANARYTPFDGKTDFLEAAAHWYRNEHNVELDPTREIFAVEGAVDGLADLFAILLDAGDAVAFVDPYYPSYHCMARMIGAQEVLLPALKECNFLPDLEAVEDTTWDRVRVLVLNYPNNPTGAQAPREFFEQAIAIAKAHHIIIVHDFAYAGVSIDAPQISLLSVEGALDVSVEVCSLSKMYAMAGWRAGFIAGNEQIISVAKQYHYQMGSMITSFVQDAGSAALRSDQQCVRELAQRYRARRTIVDDALRDLGFDVFQSQGGLYTWVHAPHGLSGQDFADTLLREVHVAVLPGSCFGYVGRDYVRLSLLQSEDRLTQAVARISSLSW